MRRRSFASGLVLGMGAAPLAGCAQMAGRTARVGGGLVVNVIDFGADPTGVADSTAAFNAACMYNVVHGGNDDVVMRRTIEVPPGDFRITGSVYIRKGQHLRGAGEGSSRIRLEGTTGFTDHIFKMGVGLINGVQTTDAGGQPPEISELGTVGGPATKAVVWGVAAGYRIHDLFLTSVGIGIAGLGESGTISSCQIDQALTGLLVGGQTNTFTDIKLYWCNYAIRTDTGLCANQDFVNLQIYYPVYAGIEFSADSDISGFTVTGGSFSMNEQYPTMLGQVVQRARNANNIMFGNVSFNNFKGAAYTAFVGASGNYVQFSNCVFDGLRTVNAFDQSSTAYAAYSAGETLVFNNCTFKNLFDSPIFLNGHPAVKTIVRVNGGSQSANAGKELVKFAATAPIAGSYVSVNGLHGSSALTSTTFGTANRAGWFLGSDRATVLTGVGIGTEITTKPIGPKSVYFVDTSSSAALVRLPKKTDGATILRDGDELTFIPYNVAGTSWAANNVKFVRGDNTIDGVASDLTVTTTARKTFNYNSTSSDWITV